MILIDSQKFACSACINGHRSSSCQHTDRPLFEIKKKGRPVTQCERCRELRKTRSYHSKCLCDKPDATSQKSTERDSVPSTDKTPGSKRKKVSRATSGMPALPNGIRDVLESNKTSDLEQKEQSRKRFKAMLNSCKCGCDSTKRCRCDGGELLAPIQQQAEGGSCCAGTSSSTQPPKQASPSRRLLPKPNTTAPAPSSERNNVLPQTPPIQPSPPTNSCCAAKVPQAERPSFQHLDAPIVIKPLSLPPDSTGPAFLPSIATWTTPIPSLHKHTTTTMDSCGCGDGCACAGCVEHQGAVAAAAAVAAGHHSCPDRCGTCQDMTSISMDISSLSGPSISDDSTVESLLARAIAKLPPPPPGKLSVFRSASGMDRVALVVLPRLNGAGASGSSSFGFPLGNDIPSALPRKSSADASPISSPLQTKRTKKSARFRRQIRSLSPSDDDLTDADAEGELDPDNMTTPTLAPIASNSWALAQLDVDVDLELGLAADAIDDLR